MTDHPESADVRIVAMEMRLSYQDDTIDKLNASLTDQWARIDALSRQVRELRSRLRDAEDRAPAAPGNETPPHY